MNLLTRSEEILLLAVWRLQDGAYGVTIREEVSRATAHDWTFGSIYAPLHRLEKKGYVRTRYSEPIAERGGRRRVYYELTRSGKQALLRVQEVHDALWLGMPALALD